MSARDDVPQLVRRWAGEQPDKPFVVTDADTLTYGEFEQRHRGRSRAASPPTASARARVSGCSCRTAPSWPVVAFGASRAGATARAAEHVPPPAGARGPAAHRRRRAPRAGARVPRPRLPRRPRGDRTRPSCPAAAWPSTRCRGCGRSSSGTVDRPGAGDGPTRRRAGGRAGRVGAAGRRPRRHLHVRQPRRPEGRDPHPRRRARARPPPDWTPGASPPTTGSTSRCPSSGSAGSAPASCRRWSPAPPCSPRPARSPSARCRSSNASGSRCSGAGPSRRRRWPAIARFAGADLALAASGQPRRRAARRRCRRAPGTRGEPARHDRVVRSLHRRSPRPDAAPRARRGAAAGRSTTSRCGSSTSTPARRSATGWMGEIQLRGRNLMRGICGRTPRRGVHRRRLLPDRRPRPSRRRRLPLPHRPPRRHVQGPRRDRVPERGRGARCTPSTTSGARTSSTSPATACRRGRGRWSCWSTARSYTVDDLAARGEGRG